MINAFRKIEEKEYNAYGFVAICTLLMSLACLNNPFTVGNTGTDSSVYNYVARVIVNGGMPYRDTFDHKGPLIYLIDAVGQIINKDIGVWIIELFFIFVIFLFAYKIAKLTGCGNIKSMAIVLISMFALAYYFDGGNLTEEYACAFIMISLYIFLNFFKNGSVKPSEIVICGASFAAVCLLRINMVALWGVMCIGVLIVCIQKKKVILIIEYLGLFLLGSVIVTAPIMFWLIKNKAFTPFIEDYLYFNFMYTNSEGGFRKIARCVYNFGIEGPAAPTFPILAYFCMKKKSEDWVGMVAFVFTVLSISISGRLYDHYGMILVPFISYSFSLLLSGYHDTNNVPLFIAGMCMIMILLHQGVYRLANDVVSSVFYSESDSLREAKEIAQVIQNNTREGDEITVCGNWDKIYLLSDRMSSSIYSYQNPISNIKEEIRTEYIKDIKQLETKMIVIKESDSWHEDLDMIIDRNYELIQVVGSTELYLLKGAGD